MFPCEASSFSPEQREKIKSMSQKDVSIKERRVWYNALARRIANPQGLPAGLVQKYISCNGNNKKRWELVRAFMLDEDMNLGCIIVNLVCGATLCKQSMCQAKCLHALHIIGPRKDVEVEAWFVQSDPWLSNFCAERVCSTFCLRNSGSQNARTRMSMKISPFSRSKRNMEGQQLARILA